MPQAPPPPPPPPPAAKPKPLEKPSSARSTIQQRTKQRTRSDTNVELGRPAMVAARTPSAPAGTAQPTVQLESDCPNSESSNFALEQKLAALRKHLLDERFPRLGRDDQKERLISMQNFVGDNCLRNKQLCQFGIEVLLKLRTVHGRDSLCMATLRDLARIFSSLVKRSNTKESALLST
jgi:hypothetical protein